MAENLIKSIDRVWVHSNIYDFHATIQPTIKDTQLGALDEYIAILDSYIQQLRDRANAFIAAAGAGDYMGLSKKLFGVGESDSSFAGVAKRTLSDRRFILLLSQLEYDLKPLFQHLNKKMSVLMQKKVGEDIEGKITAGKLETIITEIFVSQVIKNKKVSTAKEQGNILRALGYQGDLPKKLLTSTKGEIRDYAKDYVNQILASSNQSLAKEVTKAFKQIFLKRWDEEGGILIISKSEFNKQLDELAVAVGNRLGKEIMASLANILGSTGEAGLSVLHEWTGSGIEITVTGDKSEIAVARQMATIVKGTEDEYEKYYLKSTHHDLDKQSQTDLILTVNGVSVRAQAKNSLLTAMRDQLEENGYDYNKTMWYTRQMEGDQKLTDLLRTLLGSDNSHYATLTQKDAEAIAYLLANAAWFHYAGSESETHKKAVSKVDDKSGIMGVIRTAEKLLAISIKDFIGLEVGSQGFSVDASNIFYLIGNRIAFPVYLMLEDYKNQLLNLKTELFQLRYVMSPLSGIQPSNAHDYRENILSSLGDVVPSRGRIGQDTNVGFEMGENILSKLNGHVNFKFNIAKQLGGISYKF